MNLPDGFTLSEDERLVWRGHRSYQSQLGLILFGFITIWFLIGIIFFLIALLRVYSTEYIVTDQRIYAKYELYKKKNCETRIDSITQVNVHQSSWDKILNLGNIEIIAPKSNVKEINFIGVRYPMMLKERINNLSKNGNM